MAPDRRYAASIVLPPLVVAVPAALAFLAQVTSAGAETIGWLAVAAFAVYGMAAAATALALSGSVRRIEAATEARSGVSEATSHALAQTTLWSAALWIGVGGLLAVAGWLFVARSFLGLQYFGEAALIVAAPAMAWSYWAGKKMLLDCVDSSIRVEYTGRIWSVGVKVAIVFIGFFIVSAGALVLIIASRVEALLGRAAALEVGRFGIGIAAVTTLVFAVATWFLSRDISAPMAELRKMAAEMAEGHFATETRVFSDDEVGEVDRSFNITRRNLRSLIARLGDRGDTVTIGVRRMSEGTDSLVDNAHEQSGMAVQTSSALTEVEGQAQSVLRAAGRVADLASESAGAASELRASFTEVAKRMDELSQSVEKSSSAAIEIDAAAGETAGRTGRLAAIAADVAAFAAEMDATVEQIAQTAENTAKLSEQVRKNAEAGRDAVGATLEGIRTAQDATRRTAGAFDSLQKSLAQIDQILLFIDEVTNRTNLLSLNAAIIAAQAGGHDYGFSVIADEVGQLAERTRTATKEIAGIIRGVRPVAREAVEALDQGVAGVDRTVALAQHASSALQTIFGDADRSLDMTRSISRALAEQARASSHLHEVTDQMSENITEMQRATQGQAEATRMLALEAESVNDIAHRVTRSTEEQTSSGESIARAMEQIAHDIGAIRDQLDRQLVQAGQIAGASRVTLTIAERNNAIAEQFRESLRALVATGRDFEAEVARFRA